MPAKRIKRINVTQYESVIAHADVPIYVRRKGKKGERGKLTPTSCIIGMEIICAYIESIQTAPELAQVRKAVDFARDEIKKAKGALR